MFCVALDLFTGPIDLLLYLVRKHEVEILDVPIATILNQYFDCLEAMVALEIDEVGEFLVLAGTLLEIKSFQALPVEEEVEEEIEDPRQELVKQLLSYKKFCDSAMLLEERSRQWQRCYPRLSNDLTTKNRNLALESIQEAELWDLVSAFGRIMREKTPQMKHSVGVTDTPVSVFMQRIYYRLKREQRIEFSSMFQEISQRSQLVGTFLAVLELVRHEYARVTQKTPFGEIEIEYRESSKPLDFVSIDNFHTIRNNDDDGTTRQ